MANGPASVWSARIRNRRVQRHCRDRPCPAAANSRASGAPLADPPISRTRRIASSVVGGPAPRPAVCGLFPIAGPCDGRLVAGAGPSGDLHARPSGLERSGRDGNDPGDPDRRIGGEPFCRIFRLALGRPPNPVDRNRRDDGFRRPAQLNQGRLASHRAGPAGWPGCSLFLDRYQHLSSTGGFRRPAGAPEPA